MNEGRPYLQMWRGVQVSFCKIAIVCFLSVRYRSDSLYRRMAGTPSSPTQFFICGDNKCMHLFQKKIGELGIRTAGAYATHQIKIRCLKIRFETNDSALYPGRPSA